LHDLFASRSLVDVFLALASVPFAFFFSFLQFIEPEIDTDEPLLLFDEAHEEQFQSQQQPQLSASAAEASGHGYYRRSSLGAPIDSSHIFCDVYIDISQTYFTQWGTGATTVSKKDRRREEQEGGRRSGRETRSLMGPTTTDVSMQRKQEFQLTIVLAPLQTQCFQ
jgi:hypothetical protein